MSEALATIRASLTSMFRSPLPLLNSLPALLFFAALFSSPRLL